MTSLSEPLVYSCTYCGKEMPSGVPHPNAFACCGEVGHFDIQCPKCDEGKLEQRRHRFSTDRGPNLPDCDWMECDTCGFATDPE